MNAGDRQAGRDKICRDNIEASPIAHVEEFSFSQRLGCLFHRNFYPIIPFYLFVLIPSASLMAFLFARHVDPWIQAHLGWWVFPVNPRLRYFLFGTALILSGLGLLWVYSYLILEGRGGPCPPFTEEPRRLVICGPYAMVRHPSIVFKLTGVLGLGVAFGSLSFILIGVPLLLGVSLYLNRRGQEDPLEAEFGEAYREYRNRTPALIPRPGNLPKPTRKPGPQSQEK